MALFLTKPDYKYRLLMLKMSGQNQGYTERLKASFRKMVQREVDQFQTFDKEYRLSSHPIKRTFLALNKLNSIHSGENISIPELALEADLPEADIHFILQEFIETRLIEGFVKNNTLVLRQDTYFCQVDQTYHSVFELHFQCERCLRFICAACYRKGELADCPFCRSSLIPVPRIFKQKDLEPLELQSKNVRSSLTDYYQNQRANLSAMGLRKVSSQVFKDIKEYGKDMSFSSIKERTKRYWTFRKRERAIDKNESIVLSTITTLYDVEGKNEIGLSRLSKLTQLPIELINDIVVRLIAQQSINGFLENSDTLQDLSDDKLVLGSSTIVCELHEGSISISSAHYKCANCFRAICEACFTTMETQGVSVCLFCSGELTFFVTEPS